ncbi:hypothetical protein L1987_84076 [Smallanthus sonchifolius]|uniref:Uncharacterized protein n=1 Tax=Smallanthus sonchifolius TaxID=185202 RepID=A0ACB8YEC6_9ASTR|nr:hypothetical protein L1987_84076 [Smallanthus sonchifolius]
MVVEIISFKRMKGYQRYTVAQNVTITKTTNPPPVLYPSSIPPTFAKLQAHMEDQTNFLLDWTYFCHGKSMEELTESLLITTMELEAARFKAQEELKTKDDQIIQLKHLLNTAINEKHEAQNRYQMLLQTTTPPPPHSAVSSGEDDHITNGGFSSSDCEESIVSSPVTETLGRFAPLPEPELGFPVKALPEKGKFLEAVIKAGPLLQNILLAGPLPHWRHPPPPVDAYRIPPPPVVVPTSPPVNRLLGKFNKKRGFPEGFDSSIDTRCQRINMNGL